jgi:hypothetical protein
LTSAFYPEPRLRAGPSHALLARFLHSKRKNLEPPPPFALEAF